MRQWAQAWYNPEQGAWCVGYYESPGPMGPTAWHTTRSENEAKRQADEYNAQQPKGTS